MSDQPFRSTQIEIGRASIHVVEAGDPNASPVLFLHGWPESWESWRRVMRIASERVRAIAIDLPGIGGSTGDATDGSKRQLAGLVHELVGRLGLRGLTLVGQDAGGMVAYRYARQFDELERVVVMDTVLPGVAPWEDVLRNPYIWHFAFHSIPGLPERLVRGREREYFDYFYDALSADPARIPPEDRAAYARAYASEAALTAGFNWYRAFPTDARDNATDAGRPMPVPLLYLRGDRETGRIEDYANGLRAAGASALEFDLVPDSGHFTQEEAPEATWSRIAAFVLRETDGHPGRAGD